MSSKERVLNINVGVVGHVDAGKTALVAALSTHLSTAALDKHPQSKERGITLDLGFSSFQVPMPAHLSDLPYDKLQFTLVDCPGHASLIRTIIGGVNIIDMMLLVIDINRGLQAQAAECLVVGEITTSRMLVALNKVDQLPEQDRPKLICKAAKKLAATFACTKFSGVTMVPVAAKPTVSAPAPEGTQVCPVPWGIDDLRSQLVDMLPRQLDRPQGPFLFSVDHCFAIKGQGTVMTGTVLRGSVSVNDTIELPGLKMQKQVKSMQAFKRPVTTAVQGDRLGICVTQLDPSLMERGLAASPGTVPTFNAAVARVEKVRFYAGAIRSNARFHVCVGHTTVMADIMMFGLPPDRAPSMSSEAAMQAMVSNLNSLCLGSTHLDFDISSDYLYQEELYGLEGRPKTEGVGDEEYGNVYFGPQWILLKFEHTVTAPKDGLVIGAKFDSDPQSESCRLAFYGRLVELLDHTNSSDLEKLRVYKPKMRQGLIDRMKPDGQSAVCKGFFKKESDINAFVGLKVTTGLGEEGVIESSFGKSGKFLVVFPQGAKKTSERTAKDNTVLLVFKRYIHDPDKKAIKQ